MAELEQKNIVQLAEEKIQAAREKRYEQIATYLIKERLRHDSQRIFHDGENGKLLRILNHMAKGDMVAFWKDWNENYYPGAGLTISVDTDNGKQEMFNVRDFYNEERSRLHIKENEYNVNFSYSDQRT